jgi:hypothetical protein
MSNKRKDFEPWQENLLGFILGCAVFIILLISYNTIYSETSGTKGKILIQILQSLDKTFGKEYVFGFILIIITVAGIKSIIGYSKRNSKNKN